MRLLLCLLLAAASLGAASLPVQESGFASQDGKAPTGWTNWAAREEIAPKAFVDGRFSRGQSGALALSGADNPAVSGGWERHIDGIVPGSWYQLTSFYTAEGLTDEPTQVVCRLNWTGPGGKRIGQPDYAWETKNEGSWRRLSLRAPAPEGATGVAIQLWLHNAPKATVWWDDIAFDKSEPPQPRPVKLATIRFRPKKSAGREENVRLFSEVIARTAPAGTDVVLLPEGMTVVGTGKKYADVSEPVPGPTTKALGELARSRKTHIVAGLYEREGNIIYNTAVLIGRKGELIGKYRKVYLPREEIEAGITAGHEYPVFQTDFGKVGLMICWDVQYADPARALALAGAEVVLLPIWGGNLTLTKARAIENHVFLATSGYDIASLILDPKGEVLATTEENGTAALATLDLNRRYTWEWLGEMRGRFMREVRLDVPAVRPEFR